MFQKVSKSIIFMDFLLLFVAMASEGNFRGYLCFIFICRGYSFFSCGVADNSLVVKVAHSANRFLRSINIQENIA